MDILEKKLLEIKEYIDQNYTLNKRKQFQERNPRIIRCHECRCLGDITDINNKLKPTTQGWQECLFELIDSKAYKDSDVYKRACVTKQTFSKIRADKYYHPDKDTAIKLCIGLQLDKEKTQDLLSRAGYTLSSAIKRDLVFKFFLEKESYDITEINIVLDQLGLRILPI